MEGRLTLKSNWLISEILEVAGLDGLGFSECRREVADSAAAVATEDSSYCNNERADLRELDCGGTKTMRVYAPMFPLGTLILNSLVGPSVLRSLIGTTMFELNAEPDVCLQSQQWHKTLMTLNYQWIYADQG
jgi:hypothetical protein